MKRSNRLMRAAGVLLVCTLVTSSFVGGTFAKYVSEGKAADSARVAKWGVTISNGNSQDNGVYSGDAFKTVYSSPDGSIIETVKSDAKVVAPGTKGAFETLKITGTPEVAVEIKTEVDVELTGNWECDENGTFYCPLEFTINGVLQDEVTGTSAEEFAGKLKEILEQYSNTKQGKPIPAGTDLSEGTTNNPLPVLFWENVDLEWEWPYFTSEENDIKDTYLGDIAAGRYEDEGKTAPNIEITFTTTVTQID